MRKYLFLVTFVFALSVSVVFPSPEGRFMRDPDINKNKIVFTYEGDLWIVDSNGGTAVRLTTFPGDENSSKFSPDGSVIAFTGVYDGGNNVYTIPVSGGEPKRITFIPGSAQSIGWTPDGKRIIFRSGYENFIMRDPNLYFVDKDGSAPERFPLERGVRCSFSSDGSKFLYVRKGPEEYNWKRYKGGWYTDIWMCDLKENKFTPMTDYVGKNAYPMWIGKFMYFVSDKVAGTANIFKMNLDTKEITQITKYTDVDVITPSNDKDQIVYLHDGYLYVLDTKTDQSKKITVEVPSDKWDLRERTINPKDYVHYSMISNDGNSVAVEARGDIFVVPADKGNTTNLSNTPGTREMYSQISPDGKWVAFFSDKTGEYQLYIQKAEGGEWTPLTTALNKTNYHLLWSPDGKKILFGNKDFKIFYIDVDSQKLVKIDESNQMKNDEFYWEISDYNWSPDSKWICYSQVQYNKNSQIFIYSLEQNKKYAVTDDFFDNLYPAFDANGKYLYYVSSRNFEIQMDFYEDNHVVSEPQKIMAVQLHAGEKPPFAESLTKDEAKESKDFRIDTDGLMKRTYPLPVDAGNYFYLKAGNGKVLWCSVPKFTEAEYEEIFKPKGETKWDLHIFDMKDQKENVLSDKIKSYDLSTNGEQIIIRKASDIYTTSVNDAFKSKGAGSKLNLSGMTYTVNAVKEWTQIYDDTWRWYRDFFFDPNMFNMDWKGLGEKYRSYIPELTSRSDLNWVMLQLVGELSVSHTYIGGGDNGNKKAPASPATYTGWLGADLVRDGKSSFYKFDKIFGPTEYNLDLKAPLVRPDIDLKEGDYLIAVNGKEIKAPDDYNKYLQVSDKQKISITVNNKPSAEGAKTYEIEPIRNNSQLRYFRWLTNNINKVLKATNGEVGYMHINAMNDGGIGEFDKFWRAFRYKRGIIIDMRRNSGGWTEYFLTDKLKRKMTGFNVLHEMVPFRYPGSTSTGQFVVLSNEYNGSDGEAFLEDFKANGLGKIVGVPSWGGLTGILNTQLTIDNGTVEQSNNGFFGKESKWWIENHGGDPDVYIDNDPASVQQGKDVQLDKAIETILQDIKDHPFVAPKQPPYPDKKIK
jgi:tricorn protease